MLGTESVDSQAPLMDARLDSLGAVELRNSISQLRGLFFGAARHAGVRG